MDRPQHIKNLKFPMDSAAFCCVNYLYHRASTVEEIIELHYKFLNLAEIMVYDDLTNDFRDAASAIYEEITGRSYHTKQFKTPI